MLHFQLRGDQRKVLLDTMKFSDFKMGHSDSGLNAVSSPLTKKPQTLQKYTQYTYLCDL